MRFHVSVNFAHNKTDPKDRICGYGAEVTADSPLEAIKSAARLVADVITETPINVLAEEIPPDDLDQEARDMQIPPILRRVRP